MTKYFLTASCLALLACGRAEADQGVMLTGAAIDGGVLASLAAPLPTRAEKELAGEVASKTESCPAGMTLVEGEYCPDVEQHCLKWMDPAGSRYEHFRCEK